MEYDEIIFPIERTPAMRLMGHIWTGYISGEILVGILIATSLLAMGKSNFSIISIIYTIVFIIPLILFIHFRMVRKGKKLMRDYTLIQFDGEILSYITGFPNTTDPNWQNMVVDDKHRDIEIRGADGIGFHLRIGVDKPVRLGLWIDINDARKGAEKLNKWLKGSITEKNNTTRKKE